MGNKKKIALIVMAVLTTFIIGCCLLTMINPTSQKERVERVEKVETVETVEPAEIEYIDISPQEIKRVNETGTDYQWEELKKEIVGKYIMWDGAVNEVKDDRSLVIQPTGTNVRVSVGVVSEEDARSLVKGQSVQIKGRILRLSRFMGSSYVDIDLLELQY